MRTTLVTNMYGGVIIYLFRRVGLINRLRQTYIVLTKSNLTVFLLKLYPRYVTKVT
jgi:hypothetical protein